MQLIWNYVIRLTIIFLMILYIYRKITCQKEGYQAAHGQTVFIYLQGGLGNQLFQIFTLIAYSLKHKIPFKIPLMKKDMTSPLGERYKRPLYFDNFLKKLKPFLIDKSKHQITYMEKEFSYNEIPYFEKNLLLQGYFQSYKYFDHYRNDILNLIGLVKRPGKEMISMHFRIGDYKHNTNQHPILIVDYYIKSLQHIIGKTNKDDWIVMYFFEEIDREEVSEKINQIKSQFKNLTFRESDKNLSDWEQMMSMSLCSHNIIANSTFSWWAAYLNENKDKIICYPNVWFGGKLKNQTSDLFLDNWNEIN